MFNTVDVDTIVEMIFAHPPKPPCTYNVVLGCESNGTNNTLHMLMQILIQGARKKFGNNIAPHQISEKQFNELKQYMRSIGYDVKHNYTCDDSNNPTSINIWFEPFIAHVDCRGNTCFF